MANKSGEILGLEFLRFAIENPALQTLEELEESYRAQHDVEEETDKQEFHNRVIESISNYDGEVNFSEEAEKIYKNEQIEIEANLPLADFLLDLIRKRNLKAKTTEFLSALDEDPELKEFYDTLHPNVQQKLIRCCDDKEAFLYNVGDVRKDRKYYHGLKKGKKKEQLLSWFQRSNATDFEFMAEWLDISVDEIEKYLYSDKSTKAKVQLLIKKHKLAVSSTLAMVNREEEQTSDTIPEPDDDYAGEEEAEKTLVSEEVHEEIPEEHKEDAYDGIDPDPDGGFIDDWLTSDNNGILFECLDPFVTNVKVTEIGIPGTLSHYVMWSSDVSAAQNPGELFLDTCVLMQNPALTALANAFSRLYVSTITVHELRHLLDTERTDKEDIQNLVNKAFRIIADEQMKEPNRRKILLLKDDDPDMESGEDCDIQLINRAKEQNITFVTRDAGAAVYARSIGAPCRFLKQKFPTEVCQFNGIETYVLDTEVLDGGILTYLQKHCSNVIITSEYAVFLNRRKEASSQNDNVKKMQNAIATDINKVFLTYENRYSAYGESRIDYENELISLCKAGGYTFITASIISYVWALAHGCKAQLWYHGPTK